MVALSQRTGQAQIQQQTALPMLLQTQSIIMMQTQELEERIDMELRQNPALYLEDPLADDEEPLDLQEEDEDHYEDFDKPSDEYETGDRYIEDKFKVDNKISALENIAVDLWGDEPERLKKALNAIDEYRQSGIMSDDILREKLIELEAVPGNQKSFFKRPDITVTTDNGQVEVSLVHNKGDYLKYKSGMGNNTTRAQAFINDIDKRKIFLQKLCDLVLAVLQKDFFLAEDSRVAFLNLLPISVPILCNLITDELFPTKSSLEKFIYRAENLIVSCDHGNFPFTFFLPSEPSLILLWINEAKGNGKIKQEEQLQWIKTQIEKRVSTWAANDRRRDFVQPLIDINIDKIKYANKKANRGMKKGDK